LIQAQKQIKACKEEWETCRNYYLKLPQLDQESTVPSDIAVDSKIIARVVGKKKRHIYLGQSMVGILH